MHALKQKSLSQPKELIEELHDTIISKEHQFDIDINMSLEDLGTCNDFLMYLQRLKYNVAGRSSFKEDKEIKLDPYMF